MSAHAMVEIRCNGPRVGRECPNDEARTGLGTATNLRWRPRIREGWETSHRTAGPDRCPSCKEGGGR